MNAHEMLTVPTEWTQLDAGVWRKSIAVAHVGGEGLPDLVCYVVVEVPAYTDTSKVSVRVFPGDYIARKRRA